MPKGRKITKVGNYIKRQNVQRKFRIGTRKAGKPAHEMTTDDLKAVLERESDKRYHNKVRAVLALRGVVA